MHRSLLPFILATLGFIMILWASAMPVFEWQISEIVTDFPPTYEVQVDSSPWIARFGDSLDHKSYVFRRAYVSEDKQGCFSKDLSFGVRRSQNDDALEQVLLIINEKNVSWLLRLGLIEIVLSGIYIWWFTIWHEHHSFFDPVLATILAAVIFGCALIPFAHLLGPKIGVDAFASLNGCHGTLMFSAKLSKVHYETMIALFVGILAEAGALGMMVHQIAKAITQRKESSGSVVG